MAVNKLRLSCSGIKCVTPVGGKVSYYKYTNQMNYCGFGILKDGTRITVPFTDLGDFAPGQENRYNPSKMLFDIDLPFDAVEEVPFVMWLIENNFYNVFKKHFHILKSRVEHMVDEARYLMPDDRKSYIVAFNSRIQEMNDEAKKMGIQQFSVNFLLNGLVSRYIDERVMNGIHMAFRYNGRIGERQSMDNIHIAENKVFTGFSGEYHAKFDWNFTAAKPYDPFPVFDPHDNGPRPPQFDPHDNRLGLG